MSNKETCEVCNNYLSSIHDALVDSGNMLWVNDDN